jgi:hypothetical protein
LRGYIVEVDLILVAGSAETNVRGETLEGDELAVGGNVGVPAVVVEQRAVFCEISLFAPPV